MKPAGAARQVFPKAKFYPTFGKMMTPRSGPVVAARRITPMRGDDAALKPACTSFQKRSPYVSEARGRRGRAKHKRITQMHTDPPGAITGASWSD